ncbi:MAG: DEAD/DEAH box helicase [Myxococcales bacterium]|nr:DEAD/DEAH box helicase [Myxococcales bacterium]
MTRTGPAAAQGPPTRALGGLRPSAAAALLARSHATGWLVVPTRDEADRWLADLRFYASLERSPTPTLLYPADDGRPWDGVSPDPDLSRMRITARAARGALVVAPAKALLLKVPALCTLELRPGARLDQKALLGWLTARGYLVVQQVDVPGTVAVRGEVVDVWGAGSTWPVRIARFDQEIEAMRAFDPDRQAAATAPGPGRPGPSRTPLARLELLPMREAVLDRESAERAAAYTLGLRHARAEPTSGTASGYDSHHLLRIWKRVVDQLRDGLWFQGAEDYLAALQPLEAPLAPLDLRGPAYVWEPVRVHAELTLAAAQVQARWSAMPARERPLTVPEDRYGIAEGVDLSGAIALTERALTEGGRDADAPRANTISPPGVRALGELAPVVRQLRAWVAEGRAVTLVAQDARVERVVAMLHNGGLDVPVVHMPAAAGTIGLIPGALSEGFVADTEVWVTADDMFGSRVGGETPRGDLGGRGARGGTGERPQGRTFREAQRKSFANVQPGQLLVHVRHGIGRYAGIARTPAGVEHGDFVTIEYRDGARLHVPIHRLDLITPYQGAGGEAPKLDRLGGATWDARRAKVRDAIAQLASELLLIQARRALATAPAFSGRDDLYLSFEEGFPYLETPDQEAAIHDVLEDLASGRPMDRVVIGDVGFGKTEVAMRAAFRVAQDGWQVALLCPTSVLAMQHGETFHARFHAATQGALRVETLSRLTSSADERRILADLAEGRVDVLIGTSRVLSADVRFRRLGLFIVDEEHRFGIRQKEELRRSRHSQTGVHALTLTATPIPRTLQMALTGLRELSVISTPPAGRQRIRTEVVQYSPERVKEDIHHELRRGGQVFFVHNRVQSIEGIARWLRALVPEARIGVAHGQMSPAVLERALRRFIRGDDNVLISTAIIESGIDLPMVNTMIINRGEMFGLAQLYQLRGRVGRGNVRAHCTVLVSGAQDAALPGKGPIYERLHAFQKHNELGSNFALASEDLDQRGAGEILGHKQHGQIAAIGFDAYLELLEEAVARARGQSTPHRIDPDVEIGISATLPDAWIAELPDRLDAYQQMALARTAKEADRVFASLVDRHGKAPAEAEALRNLTHLRIECRALGIERLALLKVRAVVRFAEPAEVAPATPQASPAPQARAAQLAKDNPRRWTWDPVTRQLDVRFAPEEALDPWRFVRWVYASLEG